VEKIFFNKKNKNEHPNDLDNLDDPDNPDVIIHSPKVSASFFNLI